MKPAKDKLKKFRQETAYPHHRSDGLHPKRARALMAKVARGKEWAKEDTQRESEDA